MPRFNNSGRVTPQLGWYWFDQSHFILQDCSSGKCQIKLSNGALVVDKPVHSLLANGNRVWAFVEHVERADPTQVPYRDSFGRQRVNTFPVAIGPEGNIAVKPHSNHGTTVLEPDGSEWELPPNALEVRLLTGKRAAWTEGGVAKANFPLIGASIRPVWGFCVAEDGMVAYQRQDDGALVVGGKIVAPPSDKYFYPDIMLLDNVYMVTWSPNQADTNAQFLMLTKEKLATLPPDVPVSIEKPKEPKPEEPTKPMFTSIQLPEDVQLIVNTLYTRHRELAHGDDDQRRQLTQKIAEQVRFSKGSDWGWKKASGPPSKDAIAKKEGGFLHGFDLFAGDTRKPHDRPMSIDITAQTFIEVQPVNHLDQVVVTPPPSPPPPLDNGAMKRLAALEEAVAKLLAVDNEVTEVFEKLSDAIDETNKQLDKVAVGCNRPFRVKGKTTDKWGHAHDIDIEVKRES